MTLLTQPDLFGELDAAAAEDAARAEWYRMPQTCHYCGRTEPNGVLFNNNHGGGEVWGYCVAMWLTRNHVVWAATQPDPSHLERQLARAREVWHLHLDELYASLAERGVILPEGSVA